MDLPSSTASLQVVPAVKRYAHLDLASAAPKLLNQQAIHHMASAHHHNLFLNSAMLHRHFDIGEHHHYQFQVLQARLDHLATLMVLTPLPLENLIPKQMAHPTETRCQTRFDLIYSYYFSAFCLILVFVIFIAICYELLLVDIGLMIKIKYENK